MQERPQNDIAVREEAHRLLDVLFDEIEADKWFGCVSLHLHSHGGTVKSIKETHDGRRGQ